MKLTHRGGDCDLEPGDEYEVRVWWEPVIHLAFAEWRLSRITEVALVDYEAD